MAKKRLSKPMDTLTSPPKKLRLADRILAENQKKFGKDRASLDGLSEIRDYVDTRCFALNTAIGRPGIPSGRLTVIQGKESSGKTTLALQIGAEVQARGGIVIYLECESALEADRAAAIQLYTDKYVQELGLDIEPLIILTPTHILEAFAMIELNIKAARVDNPDGLVCIIWDSVAATPTTAEAKDDNDDYASIQPGLAARQVSMGFRRLTHIVNKNQIVLICLNFIKEKINSGFGGFGDNTATIAQKPLGQHASVRIQLVTIGTVGTKKSLSSGVKVLAKVNKNKIAPPHREAEFDIIYATGTDNEGSMLTMARAYGIVGGKGANLTYLDTKFRARDWPKVDCHDEVVAALKTTVEDKTKALLGNWKPVPDDDDEDDDEEYGPAPSGKKKVDDDDA